MAARPIQHPLAELLVGDLLEGEQAAKLVLRHLGKQKIGLPLLRDLPFPSGMFLVDRVRQFLMDLEEKRGCGIATRNQRLAAIQALARFIGLHAPELVAWCGQVRTVPFKKASQALVTYLEKPEMDALLAAPNPTTTQGRRDHAWLLFLYNAGTRAPEWLPPPQHECEIEAIRRCIRRGRPFGSQSWVERTSSQLGLEPTLRAPHRPRKIPRAETAET